MPTLHTSTLHTSTLSAVLLACLAACGGSSVLVTTTTPARLPLKTIPNVYLVAGDEDVEALIPSLVHALQSGGVQVSLVSEATIAAMRNDARIRHASAVVLLRLQFTWGTATRARDRDETLCGPQGCITRPRTVFVQVSTLEAQLAVQVREGPSNRALQELTFHAEADTDVVDVLRHDSIIRQLRDQLIEALDPQRRSLRIRLEPIALAGADVALRWLEQGEWTRGREALEALKARADGLSDEARAAFYYNLGVARRFDPESLASDEDLHFDATEEALRGAVRLDPQPLYANALEEAQRHRSERVLLAAQARAAGENFRVGETVEHEVVPDAPAAYRRSPQPAP